MVARFLRRDLRRIGRIGQAVAADRRQRGEHAAVAIELRVLRPASRWRSRSRPGNFRTDDRNRGSPRRSPRWSAHRRASVSRGGVGGCVMDASDVASAVSNRGRYRIEPPNSFAKEETGSRREAGEGASNMRTLALPIFQFGVGAVTRIRHTADLSFLVLTRKWARTPSCRVWCCAPRPGDDVAGRIRSRPPKKAIRSNAHRCCAKPAARFFPTRRCHHRENNRARAVMRRIAATTRRTRATSNPAAKAWTHFRSARRRR